MWTQGNEIIHKTSLPPFRTILFCYLLSQAFSAS